MPKTLIRGGEYVAEKNDDGTYNIRDVPIFAECDFPLKRGGTFRFTEQWLQGAVQRAAKREAEGYMARVHVHHHGEGQSVQDAGYLRPTRVGEVVIDGATKKALYADFLGVPVEVYDRIRQRRLPYRSIEAVPQDGFIDSLALMPTQAPFHRLPMLTIGEERDAEAEAIEAEEIVAASRAGSALVACFSRGHAISALSEFPMPDTIKAQIPEQEEESDEIVEAPEGGEETEPEAAPEAESSSGWRGKLKGLKECSVTAEEIPSFVAELRAFADALEKGVESDGEETDMPNPEASLVPDMGPVEPMSAKSNAEAVTLEARLAVAEGRIQAMEREREVASAVEKAMRALDAYAIGADPKSRLTKIATEKGVKALDVFVEAVKEQGRPAGDSISLDTNNTDPDAVRFVDPDEYAMAVRAGRLYDAVPQSARDMPRERFIQTYVSREKARR